MRPNLHPNAYVNPYSTLFRNVNQMVDTLNRLHQSDTRPSDAALAGSVGARPAPVPRTMKLPVDAWMNDDAYIIRAFVPGVNPENVEIVFREDELTIRGVFPTFQPEPNPEQNAESNGERSAEAKNPSVVMVKRELFSGAFERRLSFGLPVNPDAIEAHYSQGVLTLRVPKAEAVKPRQIRVTAK